MIKRRTKPPSRPCSVRFKVALVAAMIATGCFQPAVRTIAQQPSSAAAASLEIDFARASPVDEAYRKQFLECDQANTFGGVPMSEQCSRDRNNLIRLVSFPRANGLPGAAIVFTSKLGVDYDGSWVAAHTPGMTDNKHTSKEYPGPDGRNIPTDSDAVPYIVIPNWGSADSATRNAFARKTGIQLGDFAVVIFGGKIVPVVVADGGPFNKIGEGSVALHRALGREFCLSRNTEGVCTKLNASPSSIGGDVTTIVFTGSNEPNITAASLAMTMQDATLRLYGAFRQAYGGPP